MPTYLFIYFSDVNTSTYSLHWSGFLEKQTDRGDTHIRMHIEKSGGEEFMDLAHLLLGAGDF